MKKFVLFVLLFGLLAVPFQALAATQEDVKAFVQEAANFAKEVGKDKALAEFMDGNGKFVRGELYIFAYTFDGMVISLQPKPALVGKNLIKLVDANGVKIIEEFIKIVTTKGEGWVEYNWENPVSKKVAPKVSYVVNINDQYLIGSGMYK